MQFLQERLFNFILFLQCNFLDKGTSSLFSNLTGISLICFLCKPVLPDLAICGLLGYFFSPFCAKSYLFGILGNFDIDLNICLKLVWDYFAFILCPLPTVEYNSEQVKIPFPPNSPISSAQTIILYSLTQCSSHLQAVFSSFILTFCFFGALLQ